MLCNPYEYSMKFSMKSHVVGVCEKRNNSVVIFYVVEMNKLKPTTNSIMWDYISE